MVSMKEDYVHIPSPQNSALKTAQSEEIMFACYFWRQFAAFKSCFNCSSKPSHANQHAHTGPDTIYLNFTLDFLSIFKDSTLKLKNGTKTEIIV